MRLTSFLILAVIVVAGVGIFGLNAFGLRDKIFQKAQEGHEAIQGFSAAKTPTEAMDLFAKAIQERRYKTAAKYVVGNYGAQLVRAHDAAYALGSNIDTIKTYTVNKGFASDRITFFLQLLDPFPTNFQVQGQPQQNKDGDKAQGSYLYETLAAPNLNNLLVQQDMGRMDGRMFLNNLHPYGGNLSFQPILVAEGTGDAKQWKLQIDVNDFKAQAITYLNDHYKGYVSGMEAFMREANNQRYGSKADYEKELINVLVTAK